MSPGMSCSKFRKAVMTSDNNYQHLGKHFADGVADKIKAVENALASVGVFYQLTAQTPTTAFV